MADLGSKWGSLNPKLLATIYPVERDGARGFGQAVVAPITDANIELTANWQSPFEGAGLGSKFPTLMALVQTAALENVGDAAKGTAGAISGDGIVGGLVKDVLKGAGGGLNEFSEKAQGRTGMTKLNSTQVFTGSPPVKIPLTLHFRAFDDPASEVQAPIDQLARWMLAQKLEKNGSLVALAKGLSAGNFIEAFLPSVAPQMVALVYGGYLFSPMVIESMAHPITVPRSSKGEALHVSVSLMLATLTSLDALDWRRARNGQPTLMFNNK